MKKLVSEEEYYKLKLMDFAFKNNLLIHEVVQGIRVADTDIFGIPYPKEGYIFDSIGFKEFYRRKEEILHMYEYAKQEAEERKKYGRR